MSRLTPAGGPGRLNKSSWSFSWCSCVFWLQSETCRCCWLKAQTLNSCLSLLRACADQCVSRRCLTELDWSICWSGAPLWHHTQYSSTDWSTHTHQSNHSLTWLLKGTALNRPDNFCSVYIYVHTLIHKYTTNSGNTLDYSLWLCN